MTLQVRSSATADLHSGASAFPLRNRIFRAAWLFAWALLASWTPAPLHRWRALVLRRFGAKLAPGARVYGSAAIWFPPNLVMGAQSVLGPRVRCYNQGMITIGERVVVSQDAQLCASTHDASDPAFRLILRPITIRDHAWIAAEAFIGPGVTVGEGAIIGARAALFVDAEPWTIYAGNRAAAVKPRVMRASSVQLFSEGRTKLSPPFP